MLTPGTRLGPYEIVAAIGAGAMGEVYRARDQRLHRDVAVKILPPAFASDPERLQRFEQEARAAGQLHHPNILTIYDVGNQDGVPYEVSELLEGQTLRDLLADGPPPMRRALDLATQIAQGLAAAHEHGIVHRDLKPENLFVTHDGRLKILDFGLAKLTRPDGAAALREYDSLAGTMTATGVVLGTAGYMAPEQVRGDAVDARTDLFAFGAILYEMVSGRRAFRGESAIDTLHAILRADPAPLAESRADLPPALERVIQHCLEKRPDQRFQSARDVAFALESLAAPTQIGIPSPALGAPARGGWMRGAALVLIVALATAGVVMALGRSRSRGRGPRDVRFALQSPEGTTLPNDGSNQAISPDGQVIAIVAFDSARVSHIWVRPLRSLRARELDGTDGAFLPFWSPDSRWIGYFVTGALQRVPAEGGRPERICAAPNGRGAAWNRDGVILFAPGPAGPLYRVAASGGEPTPVTRLDSTRRETAHRFPSFLPDGRHFVFVSLPPHEGSFDVNAGALGSDRLTRVGSSAAAPVYVEPGYLVLVRQQDLIAQPFDARSLRLHGEARMLGDAPGIAQYDGESMASASKDGALVFGSMNLENTRLEWFDRSGRSLGLVNLPPGRYENLALSPDDRTVAIERRNSPKSLDLWTVDLARGLSSRFSFGGGENSSPVWSPGGDRVAFFSNKDGPQDLYVKRADMAGEEQRIFHSPVQFKVPFDWTPDGRSIVFAQLDPKTQWDEYLVPADGNGAPTPLLQGPFNEIPAAVSPDGGRLAYLSDESGRTEIYLGAFPRPGGRYQVSTAGANPQPNGAGLYWVRKTSELLFGAADGLTMMSCRPRSKGSLEMTEPVLIGRLPLGTFSAVVSSDGNRILATVPTPGGRGPGITVLLDWTALLGR